MEASTTALVLIDIQQGIAPPADQGLSRSTPDFEQNIAQLLKAFRNSKAHIIHVHHHSRHTDSRLHHSKSGIEPMPYAAPLADEPTITKSTNSAFVNTYLAALLKDKNIKRVVFCGATTQHCVSTTIRGASDLQVVEHTYGGARNPLPGRIVAVNDATMMYDCFLGNKKFDAQTAHETALAHLQDEFCSVESTIEVIDKLQQEG